jgi:hypothetical protein
MRRGALATAALIGLLALAARGGETVRLRLKLPEGFRSAVTMTTEQDITQVLQGRTIRMEQTMAMTYIVEVTEVDEDGAMTVRHTYTRVRLKQAGAGMLVEYDSDDPPETVPMQARGFAGLVGGSFALNISAEGEVLGVEGTKALIDGIIKQMQVPAGPQEKQMRQLFEQQFGDEAMRKKIEPLTAIYPAEPVAVGDSWTRTGPVPVGHGNRSTNTWTLKELTDGQAVLSVRSEFEPAPEDAEESDDAAGATPDVQSLSGSQQGTMRLNVATGWTERADLAQNLSMTVKNSGLSIPVTLKGSVTLAADEADEAAATSPPAEAAAE